MKITKKKPTSQILNSATIPLNGRHLIEASAGTGKTYNITRIYLRLLLEKELSVQQILVMTFTKAATEELRGRIDKELRHALNHWGSLGETDPFFELMEAKFTLQYAQQKLKPALLELDEASIYTIHGFCSRALSSQAFASGLAMDITMESDSSELLLESTRDWLRKINQDEVKFNLLTEKNWHQPAQFLSQFNRALKSSNRLETADSNSLQEYFDSHIDANMGNLFNTQKIKVLEQLEKNKSLIFETLIDGKKDKNTRCDEWSQLLLWLNKKDASESPKELASFINGNRYRANELLKAIFEPIKNLKVAFSARLKKVNSTLQSQIESSPVYQLACQGIYEIRENFAKEKAQQAIMDFDDLITYLNNRVQSPQGQTLIDELRLQYPVALVDEFQDTDPNQYAILDKLYPQSKKYLEKQQDKNIKLESTLFMIGDPKQAIYAFRGGDIFTYLQARKGADQHWYMDTNWRSVEGVVSAYNRLFFGAPLDQTKPLIENTHSDVFGYDIAYERIKFTPKAEAVKTPLSDPDSRFSSMNYCLLNEVTHPSGEKGEATTEDWKNGLAQWCATEISRLLAQVQLGKEPLQEKHLAILVRTGTEAQIMRDVLEKAGFPSVYLSDKENIFKSKQAQELLLVLKGILDCENNSLLTTALSSYLMAGNAEKLALYHEQNHVQHHQQEHEQAWEKQRDRAVQLRETWLKKGCMSMLMQLIGQDYQPEPSQHERSLTNMIHLAELLQQASLQYKHPQQLLKWFIDQCDNDTKLDEAQLRLESDANLIRIVTQHGSKGLEYPIVFIPFASAYKDPVRFGNTLYEYFEYHEAKTYQAKYLIGQSEEAIDLTIAEAQAETIRLLYVAITRAVHRCYVGVAPFKNSIQSPLGLSLKLADNKLWEDSLQQLVESSNKSSSLINIDETKTKLFSRQKVTPGDQVLRLSKLEHAIDTHWLLSSFSNLTRDSYVLQAQEEKDRIDESIEKGLTETKTALADKALRFALKKGVATGQLLHDILEQTNFTIANVSSPVSLPVSSVVNSNSQWQIEAPLRRFGGLEDKQQLELTLWLKECLDTPLPAIGLETKSFKLSDLSWSHTLRETEFYFPLKNMHLKSLLNCLQQHRNSNRENSNTVNGNIGKSKNITLPSTESLKGMMKGYIDLIFEHNGRFYIADYKSSHLGDHFRDYHWQILKDNNQHHFYDLQYLIYSLALHRYLQLRLTNYHPQEHFGGVYYLYLRGMSTKNDDYFGIFHTPIDGDLLFELDRIFQGKISEEVAL